MKIIAIQGSGAYLIDLEHDGLGQAAHTHLGRLSPPHSITSIVARGYWDDVNLTDPDLADQLADVLKLVRPVTITIDDPDEMLANHGDKKMPFAQLVDRLKAVTWDGAEPSERWAQLADGGPAITGPTLMGALGHTKREGHITEDESDRIYRAVHGASVRVRDSAKGPDA